MDYVNRRNCGAGVMRCIIQLDSAGGGVQDGLWINWQKIFQIADELESCSLMKVDEKYRSDFEAGFIGVACVCGDNRPLLWPDVGARLKTRQFGKSLSLR